MSTCHTQEKSRNKQIRSDPLPTFNLIPQLNIGIKEFPTLRIVVTPAWSAVRALRFMRFFKTFRPNRVFKIR